jgi:hypothetical protein
MKPSRTWKAAQPAIIALLAMSLFSGLSFAQEENPPGRVARVSYLSGKVSLEPASENQWSQVSLNYPMTNNDRLYTSQGARAEIEVGSAAVRMSETTDLTLADLTDTFMQLGLAQGTIQISVYELPSGQSIEVDTPNGALTLQQPGYYRVDTVTNTDSTVVSVYRRGSVQLSGGGLSQIVTAGQAIRLTGSGPVQATYVSIPRFDSFDRWCTERDRLFAPPPYVSPYMVGYAGLEGYGAWATVAPYGPVWYPNVTAGWVPYRLGRWVWVSPWGWTWIEEEPWGFAPFHYGRWAYIGYRWGWIPGPVAVAPYYAPALVAFAGGPGISFAFGVGGPGVAWFPLGPHDPFFPWYHYGPTYLREINVTNVRYANIVNLTHVTDIRSVHYAYERIGLTAVPGSVFRSGQLLRNHVMRLRPQQVAGAEIIPHPSINPRVSAVLAGRAVGAPTRTPRFAALRPVPSRSFAARPGVSRGALPSLTRRPLISRTPLAPRNVPFATRLRAMGSHPGRPLEPQQLRNLRAGRAAGPMRDHEFPPHLTGRSGGGSRGGGRRR